MESEAIGNLYDLGNHFCGLAEVICSNIVQLTCNDVKKIVGVDEMFSQYYLLVDLTSLYRETTAFLSI